MGSAETLTVVYTASGIAVLWAGWFKLARPKWRRWVNRFNGAIDTVIGREEFTDNVTGERVPAVPPLGIHLAEIRRDVSDLTEVVGQLTAVVADQKVLRDGFDAHELRLNDHDTSIAVLIGDKFQNGAKDALAAVERANANVIDVDPS